MSKNGIIVTEGVNAGITDAAIGFARYLNRNHGFNVSIDSLIQVIASFDYVDIFDKKTAKCLFKTMMCNGIGEYFEFDSIFDTYFTDKSFSMCKKMTEEIKNEEMCSAADEVIDKDSKRVGECASENSDFEVFEEEIIKLISMITSDEWATSDLINVCKMDHDAVRELVRSYIIDNDARYVAAKDNLEKLMKLCVADKNKVGLAMYLLKAGQYLQNVYNHIKEILDKRSKSLTSEMKEIEKAMSKKHREDFVYGHNAVKTCSELMEENLTELSNSDIVRLSAYIRQNASKFKTKIALNRKKSQKADIDFKKTVRNSIKADGIPFKIEHRKSKPSKTKIVTICDVSGSCIKSSKMLLSFLYELQSVFPGGCESYVFNSELAEVTHIFRTMEINEACNKAAVIVPRTYSNYGKALSIFEKNYMSQVGRDTVVLILGDARNNKNKTGKEIIAKMKSKAKKVYWLETDPKERWGEGDSDIFEYLPYVSEIREVIKPKDIVDFLCNVKC